MEITKEIYWENFSKDKNGLLGGFVIFLPQYLLKFFKEVWISIQL
jgi:hypothetical protein